VETEPSDQHVGLPSAGQLTQFNMNGWNLGGNFPVDQLARFRALSEIDISNNPNMRADLKKMFDSFAQLQNLQVRPATHPQQPRSRVTAASCLEHHVHKLCSVETVSRLELLVQAACVLHFASRRVTVADHQSRRWWS
jgi:hypothetical protein